MKTLILILALSLAAFAQSPSPTPTGPALSGMITYGDTGRPVPQTVVFGRLTGGGYVMTTNRADGTYEVRGFQPGTYTMYAYRTGGHDSSISSYDAALIGQYVVSAITFTPIQKLAADVSGNGEITSFDAALAAQYAVGAPPTNSLSMWITMPSSYSHTDIFSSISGENYKAIILGDVSENWVMPTPTPILSPTPAPPMPSPSNTPPDWNRCDHYAREGGRPDWPGTYEQPWDIATGLNAYQHGYQYTCTFINTNVQPTP